MRVREENPIGGSWKWECEQELYSGQHESSGHLDSRGSLVLSGPGVESGTVDAQVRQVDVTPTLLDLFGVEPGGGAVDGESLLREENWQRAVRADGRKYVVYPNRDWGPELYDLAADPLELHPLEEDPVAARLASHVPEAEVGERERLAIDGLLEDLGYK